jgi:hypothetical protein
MSVEQTLVVAVVSVVIGAVVGAFLTAALQYFFWKRQHREELKSAEEREVRRERARAAERFREVAGLLIEINRGTLLGQIDQTQLNATILTENHRLRRELRNTAAAVRDAFPDQGPVQDERLDLFQRQMTEKIPLNLSQESANALRSELNAIVAQLRALVSISDK